MSTRWRMTGDLQGNLEGMNERNKRAIVAAANYVAPQAESYMRTNATWTDRTGNARSGLRSKVFVSRTGAAIVLYHSVPYGVWLEVRFSGRYAIIKPTMDVMTPKFIEAIGKLMFK